MNRDIPTDSTKIKKDSNDIFKQLYANKFGILMSWNEY